MIYSSGQLVQKTIDKISNNNKSIENTSNEKSIEITGISSSIYTIDEITLGWQPSDLIIIGGCRGMGKTNFITSMLNIISLRSKVEVAVFSLDLTSTNFIHKMIHISSGISSSKLRKGKLKKDELKLLKKLTFSLSKAPIYIDDSPSLSISELKKKALHLVIHQKVKLIIIDYLQLLTIDSNSNNCKNRDEELSLISKILKALARELNVPIIVLSQLSKKIDKREIKRPRLSDLLGSKDIEVYADIVSFIYRPEYYGIKKWDNSECDRVDGTAEFIIAKNLRGPIDNVCIRYISHIGLFAIESDDNRKWGPPKT